MDERTSSLRRMTIGMNSAGEGTRVLPGVAGLHGDLGRFPSGHDTGRRFSARGSDAARQLDGVCIGGQGLLGGIESSGSVRSGIFDRGTEVL